MASLEIQVLDVDAEGLRGIELLPPAGVVSVCENPRVLEAAVDAGCRSAVVCTQGQPAVVVVELPHLGDGRVAARWDPSLTDEMGRANRAIDEDLVLDDLLFDLSPG